MPVDFNRPAELGRPQGAYEDASRPPNGPYRAVRLVCAAGHEYSGEIQDVWDERRDNDGFHWYSGREACTPARCIVCGNLTKGEKETK